MIVVNVPTEPISDKEGNITPAWRNYFEQSTQQMQQSLSNEGFWIPALTTAQLTIIAASYVPPTGTSLQPGVNLGTLVYDSTTNQPKIFLSDSPTTASFHVVTTV